MQFIDITKVLKRDIDIKLLKCFAIGDAGSLLHSPWGKICKILFLVGECGIGIDGWMDGCFKELLSAVQKSGRVCLLIVLTLAFAAFFGQD